MRGNPMDAGDLRAHRSFLSGFVLVFCMMF
jgi:hypothetical protein